MDNFDLRKYLTEGRLLKEAIDYSSIKGEMKKIYDIDVDLDTIKDFVISYNDSEGMDVFDTTEREDFYLYLKDEDRLLKEELTPLQQYVYNFEKEVSGEDNAKEFLDGIKKLNTPKDVYDYYAFERNWEGDSDLEGDLENLYNQVLDKFKSKNENKMDNFDLKKYLAEGKLHEGLFSKKPKLYIPKGINQIHNYVNDRQVKDIEAKIKSKEISPKQLSGINSVMMAIEEFLKAKLGIIENEKNGIKFLIYPTGKAGGLTDSKLDLYINLPQKGKPNNLRTNPEETLKMMKIFIDDYLKKQEGIDVASAKVKKSNDSTAYDVTVPISFTEKVTEISSPDSLNEFVGKELEDRNEPLYDKLVPGSGKADTVEGEMLRAINRIVYRYYNDGDEYHTGYGTETAGPAHSFLVNANHPLRSLVSTLFKKGTNYEQTIKDVLDAILDHIESRQGKYTPNNEDMYDYESEFEDDTYEEEDYDYDENEEQF